MNRIVIERRVSDDGSLQLDLPLVPEEAGLNVRITIEPVSLKPDITQEEWQAGILATAGGWQGEFERPVGDVVEDRGRREAIIKMRELASRNRLDGLRVQDLIAEGRK